MFLSGLSGLGGWSAHAQCAQIPRSVRLEKRRGVEREGERGGEQLQKEKERQDGHEHRLSLRLGPFLGVGWVDLPPRCAAAPLCWRAGELECQGMEEISRIHKLRRVVRI